MGEKTISALIEGGSASAGPPLGPQLGPLPVDIGEVVSTINQKTGDFEGMTVPIEVVVDEETGDFEIEVGTPPVAALVKQRAGIESGSGEPNKEKVGNISMEDVADIAEMKWGDLNALTHKSAANEVLGSCVSMGVTVEDTDAEQVIQDVNNGEYDDYFNSDL